MSGFLKLSSQSVKLCIHNIAPVDFKMRPEVVRTTQLPSEKKLHIRNIAELRPKHSNGITLMKAVSQPMNLLSRTTQRPWRMRPNIADVMSIISPKDIPPKPRLTPSTPHPTPRLIPLHPHPTPTHLTPGPFLCLKVVFVVWWGWEGCWKNCGSLKKTLRF